MVSLNQRIRGCLLGGAVGDALGAPIEFDSLAEIRRRFGRDGLTDYAPAFGRRGTITDDTQMSLFTGEGLIRAWVRMEERGICHPPSVVHHAYLRWLLTQSEQSCPELEIEPDGWLFAVSALHSRREPGTTCISSLRAASRFGVPEVADNASKGCGGVMRVAPVGLMSRQAGSYKETFKLGIDTASLTHGHPTGYLAAGYFATVIAAIVSGESLLNAMDIAYIELAKCVRSEEVKEAIEAARRTASLGAPSPEQIEMLGGGWIAEEALAITLCCALTARDFKHGVLMAVNHSGDSDSTGAMTGNLLGSMLGANSIPGVWLRELECRAAIEQLADDLHLVRSGNANADRMSERYPGW